MIAQLSKKYIGTRPWKLYSRLASYFLFEGRPLTTKGRWINGIVFFFFRIQKVFPKLKKVESPIYILGTGRSGTTILGIVMSMHRDIGFLNEPKAIWNSVFPDEDIIGSYSKKPGRYFLQKEDASENIKSNLNKIYGAYLRISFSKRILDKYPELLFRLPFLFELFPDSKCLFLVRNGWDTISSIEKWSDRKGHFQNGQSENWWGLNNRKWICLKEQVLKNDKYFEPVYPYLDSLTNHADFAALEWIASMRNGNMALEKYPNKVLLVKFEQLASNTSQTLNEISSFVNIDFDQKFFDYGISVLKPVEPAAKTNLHYSILPIFEQTMNRMGYMNENEASQCE